MAKIEKFEDIESWKLAREVANLVYKVSSAETFLGILHCVIRFAGHPFRSFQISQKGLNGGNKEFLQFLAIAKGLCGEVRAQLYVALDQEYLDSDNFALICDKLLETSRLLSGLMKYLRQSEMRGEKFRQL